MKQGIMICAHQERGKWLDNCLRSLSNVPFPIYVHMNTNTFDGFELAAIQYAVDIGLDEFVLLQDTIEWKNPILFEGLFGLVGKSISLCNHPYHFGCYLGKYRAETLNKLTIPQVSTKLEAVEQEEEFHRRYINLDPDTSILFPDFGGNTDVFINKFDEKRMVLENEHFIKYKSTWDRDML